MSYVVYNKSMIRTGFRPKTNPYGAAHGLNGLPSRGATPRHFPGYPFTARGAWKLSGMGQGSPAGAPTGSVISYTGQWNTGANNAQQSMAPNDILNAVVQLVNGQGLNVAKSATQYGASVALFGAFGMTFTATLTLQVTGPGFAQASDAASIVNNAVYQVTGQMPSASTAQVTGVPIGGAAPSGASNALDPDCLAGMSTDTNGNPCNQSLTQWFEQNAVWIGLGLAAVIVLPKLL